MLDIITQQSLPDFSQNKLKKEKWELLDSPQTKIIHADNHDCYNIDCQQMDFDKEIVLYDESGDKIADIYNKDGMVTVNALTKKTIYITGKIKADTISIETKGKLHFNAKASVKNDISIQAKEIIHDGIIKSQGEVSLIARKNLICGDDSLINAEQFFVKSKNAIFNGRCKINQTSDIEAQRIDTAHEMQLVGTQRIHTEQWFCYKGSNIDLCHSDTRTESNICISKDFKSQRDSKIHIHQTPEIAQNSINLTAKRAVFNGTVDFQNTNITGDYLETGKKSLVTLNQSHIKSKENIIFDGNVSCQDTEFHTDRISHAETSNVQYQGDENFKSIIKTKDFISKGTNTFSNVKLEATYANVSGSLTVDHLAIEGEDITIKPLAVSGNNLIVKSKLLHLKAADENEIELNDLLADTEIFETQGNIKLINSQIATASEKVCENLGNLHLHDSIIVSAGQFYNDKNAKITVTHSDEKQAGIKADCLHNSGDIHLDASQLAATIIIQVGKSLEADHGSRVLAEKDVYLTDQAKMAFSNGSQLDAKEASVFVSDAELCIQNKSAAQAKDVITSSKSQVSVSNSLAKIDNTLLALGKIDLKEQAMIDANDLDLLGTLTAKSSKIKVMKADVTGKIVANQSLLYMGDHVLVRPDGNVRLEDSNLQSKHLEHQGTLVIQREKKNQTTSGARTTNDNPPPLLNLDKLTTSYGSKIEGDDLSIETDEWDHYGSINLTGTLSAKGEYFWNEGKISAKNIDLGYDSLLNMSGSLSADDHIKIKAGISLNLLGSMHAHTFENSSLMSLNAGAISAWNIQDNSIISGSIGLKMPSTDPMKIFSLDGLSRLAKRGAQTAACVLMPGLSTAINAGVAGYGLYSTARNAYDKRDSFKDADGNYSSDKIQNVSIHELANVACQVSSFAVSAYNFYGQATKVGEQIEGYKADLKKRLDDLGTSETNSSYSDLAWNDLSTNMQLRCKAINYDNVSNFISKIHWDSNNKDDISIKDTLTSIGGFAAAALGPQCSSQSLVNLNAGTAVSHNINESNLYSNNSGIKSASDSVVINAAYQTNNGSIGAGYGAATLSGHALVNNGNISGGNGVYVNYKLVELMDDSQRYYDAWKLNGDILHIHGNHQFSRSQIQIQDLSHDAKVEMTNQSRLYVSHQHTVEKGATLLVDNQSAAGIASQTVKDGGKVLVDHGSLQMVSQQMADKNANKIIDGMMANFAKPETPPKINEEASSEKPANTNPSEENAPADNNHTPTENANDSTWAVKKGAEVTAKNGSHLIGDSLEQAGVVNIENHSDIYIAHHHNVLPGAKFNIKNHSTAIIESQIVHRDAEINVSNYSIHKVANKWVVKEGAVCIAEGTTEQADAIKEKVNEKNQLQDQADQEVSDLNQEINNQAKENKPTETEIATLQNKIDDEITKLKANQAAQANKLESNAKGLTDLIKKESEINDKIAKLQTELSSLEEKLDQIKLKQSNENQVREERIKAIAEKVKTVSEALSQVNSEFIGSSLDLQGKIIIKENGLLQLSEPIKMSSTGHLELSNVSFASVKSLQSDGKLTLQDSYVTADETASFSVGAQTTLQNSGIQATDFHDKGNLCYSGHSSVTAKSYQHGGSIQLINGKNNKNSLVIKAETGKLEGKATIDNGYVHIDHLANASAFAFGHDNYNNYQFTDSLNFVTQDALNLTKTNTRNCNLDLTGSDIAVNTKFDSTRNLSLTSTKGNIAFNQDVHANNIYTNSARSIYGYRAVINADQQLLFNAANGNIENHGGILRGGDYCQLIASKDILNICHETTYRGKHDTMKKYDSAIISGGAGNSSNGVGVYMKAGGRIVNDASSILSQGDNYIDGAEGVEFLARSHTYIKDKYTKKGALGFSKKHVVKIDTQVQGSTVLSGQGRNIIRSGEGSIKAIATQFISEQGSDLYAEKDVKLFSLKTIHKKYESKSSLWGLSSSKHWTNHQGATPTLIADNGLSKIHAHTGNIESRGTVYVGEGNLKLKAGKDIILSRDILDHYSRTKTQTITPTFCGYNAFNTISHGGNFWDAISSEDSTFAKFNALIHSDDGATWATNAWNFGVNGFNSANSLLHGFNDDALGTALMERYGLGDKQGFNPSFGFALTRTDTQTKSQSIGPGGIDRKNITMEAGNNIVLENGIDVHARENATVLAKKVEINAAELHSSTKTKTKTVNMAFTPSGGVVSAGGGYSQSQSKSTTYINSALHADGHLEIYADELNLNGGNIECATISGQVDVINATTKQNHHQSSSKGANVSSTGTVSANYQKQESLITDQVSGIHVKDGINVGENNFHANTVNLEGSAITSDGVINDFADNTTATDLHDYHHCHGIGFSGNVNDIARLGNKTPQTDSYSEPAIATATISVDHVNYQAIQHSTVHGAQGTNINMSAVQGPLNTLTANGKEVIHNSNLHIAVDAPITNAAYLANANQNISQGITNLFHVPQTTTPTSITFATLDDEPPALINLETGEIVQSVVDVIPGDNDEPPSLVSMNENTDEENQPIIDISLDASESENYNISQDFLDLPPLLSDQELTMEDIRIMRAAIKGFTIDVRSGFKGGKCFDIGSGRYNSVGSIINEISENNTGSHLGLKIKVQGTLFQDQYVLWNSYENSNNAFNPQLLWTSGCTYSAELDPTKYYLNPKAKFELGGELRFNLWHGSYDGNPYGRLNYAIDASSTSASAQGVLDFDGRLKAEAKVDASVMGPSVGINLQSNEFCFLGFTFQTDVTGRLGVGAKATAGVGLTCDKTQPNLRGYFLLGAGAGGCAEIEFKPSIGIDTQYQQQLNDERTNVAAQPHHQQMTKTLENSITHAKNESSSLTGWASFWNNYKINVMEETIENHNERINNEAAYNTNYGINYRKK